MSTWWLLVFAIYSSDGHVAMGSKKFTTEGECMTFATEQLASVNVGKRIEWNCMERKDG